MKLNLNGVAVESRGRSGGLAMCWIKEIDVVLQSFSMNHIDVYIYDDYGSPQWRFTGFYGNPVEQERYRSLNLLRQLSTVSNLPWLCACDFNALLSASEKSGGNGVGFSALSDFGDCLTDAGLSDLGFVGYPFTWSNNRAPPNFLEERLDRACGSDGWSTLFPNYRVTHLDAWNSDHRPILIALHHRIPSGRSRRKAFRFEAMWLKNEECDKLMEDGWKKHWSLRQNFEECIDRFKHWSSNSFGSVKKRVVELKESICDLKQLPRSEAVHNKIIEISAELESLVDKEEMMWRQRAKMHWIQEGDKNTKFFHAKASSMRRNNTITGLRNEGGVWCEEDNEIEDIILSYFRDIFKSTNPSLDQMEEVLTTMESRVGREMNDSLLREYTEDEVRYSLECMQPLKSPGPDGLPAIFFQKYWCIVGKDVTNWVLAVLNHGEAPNLYNHTHITLIPKCSNPETVAQFRPISLSNVVYKLVSKCIVNRLKPFMNAIISESQSAFVPSRLITDNVLIAFELTHYMKRSPAEHMAVKLDMSKAYDRLEWSFLRLAMLRLGFDRRVVDLIMRCVTSVTYSVVLNGRHFGLINPERGIRQGDPLSPYLFLFCAEALSALFKKEESRGNLLGLSVCNGAPIISHLMFADDTIIFCKANKNSAHSIRDALGLYGRASGQIINYQKSSILFSKTSRRKSIDEIKLLFPMEIVDKHEKYLGLPSVIGKSKREVFSYIRDRVCQRLKGWKEKWLSRGEKEILIKSVLQAIPSYAMGCFKLPGYFSREIEQLMAQFWWENTKGKGIHWVKWSDLCFSKQSRGLGFRDLEAFNMALLAKQLWRLLVTPNSLLGQVLKARYYPHTDILGARLGSNPSFTWRSIFGSKRILEAGLHWRVGDGKSILIWKYRWLPRESTFKPITPQANFPPDMRVSELIFGESNQWSEMRIREIFMEDDQSYILAIPLGSSINKDIQIWHYNQNGRFSVRSAYHLAVRLENEISNPASSSSINSTATSWKWIWKLNLPNKIKIFAWRACKNLLPTKDNLYKRKITVDNFCGRCECEVEDIFHCFSSCSFSRQVWALSNVSWIVHQWKGNNMREWLLSMKRSTDIVGFEKCVLICWAIWFTRNRFVFEGEFKEVMEVISFVGRIEDQLRHPAARVLMNQLSAGTLKVHWTPPTTNVINVNFDVAINSKDKCVGVGIVARTHLGECVGWNSICINQPLDPTSAEAKAALLAVEFVQGRSWNKIVLEGDSAVVIAAICDGCEEWSVYGNIITDIHALANSFEFFSANHVRRTGNRVAHNIARLCFQDDFCIDSLPLEIQHFVNSDLTS